MKVAVIGGSHKSQKVCESDGGIEQINGCEGETATLLFGLSVELQRAWRRFRPTSSQPFDAFVFLELVSMKFFESDIACWFWKIIAVAIASWFGGTITGILLEFILNLFGFIAFAITSTVISYFLFWFAMFGISSLIIGNSKAQLSNFILQTNIGVLVVIFAVTTAIVSSGSSAIYLIRVVEQTFPDYSMLLWLIALPFFGFIFYIAGKIDRGVS